MELNKTQLLQAILTAYSAYPTETDKTDLANGDEYMISFDGDVQVQVTYREGQIHLNCNMDYYEYESCHTDVSSALHQLEETERAVAFRNLSGLNLL